MVIDRDGVEFLTDRAKWLFSHSITYTYFQYHISESTIFIHLFLFVFYIPTKFPLPPFLPVPPLLPFTPLFLFRIGWASHGYLLETDAEIHSQILH